jgi:hypothetical protein
VQDALEEQIGAIECESGNVEVQGNYIKECDLVGKVERRARKPRFTQKIINKMHERRKWKSVNNEERRTTAD